MRNTHFSHVQTTILPTESYSKSVKSVTPNVTPLNTFRFCKVVFVTPNVTPSVTPNPILGIKKGKRTASPGYRLKHTVQSLITFIIYNKSHRNTPLTAFFFLFLTNTR